MMLHPSVGHYMQVSGDDGESQDTVMSMARTLAIQFNQRYQVFRATNGWWIGIPKPPVR